MKKKILSFMLAICLIMPMMFLVVGCGKDPINPNTSDNKNWYNIGNYEMSFEGVDYTGNSVHVFVEIKNPNNYKTTLFANAFTLSGAKTYEVLSLGVQNTSGQWVDYGSVDFEAKGSSLVKITFFGAGANSNAQYNLNYLGNKIADVTNTTIQVTVNNWYNLMSKKFTHFILWR